MLPSEFSVVAFVLASLRRVPLPEETSAQVAFHLGYLDALQRVEQALSVPARPQTPQRLGPDSPGPRAA